MNNYHPSGLIRKGKVPSSWK